MRKILLCFFLSLVFVPSMFASDITAITSDGRFVVLHDNGRWQYKFHEVGQKPYIGTWGFSEEFFDTLVELSLLESNIYPGTTEYEFYKALFAEMLKEEFLESGLIELELSSDGYAYMTIDGEEEMCQYDVDEDSRLLTLCEDDESVPFGIFSDDFSSLNILGMEGFSFSKLDY